MAKAVEHIIPPHNTQLEQILLGTLLSDNRGFDYVSGFLRPEHFFTQAHQEIFALASMIHSSGQVVDAVTLHHRFEANDELEHVGGAQYLAHLASGAMPVHVARDYAANVFALAARRQCVQIGQELVRDAVDLSMDDRVSGFVAERIELLNDFMATTMGDQKTQFAIGEVAEHVVDKIQHPDPDARVSAPTCLTDVDRLTGGLFPGEFYLLGGRPGMGKSAVAVSISLNSAMKGYGQAFFSLEMTTDRLTHRALTQLAYDRLQPIEYEKIARGDLEPNEVQRLTEAGEQLKDLPFYIDQKTGLTVTEIEAKARHLQRKLEREGQTLDVVWIDHLQLIKPSSHYAGNRYGEITEISGRLMEMSKKLNVAVVALSQLSRNLENRTDKRPILADLRDSGSLEQDADAIFFVYRHAYYLDREGERENMDSEADRMAEITKHQHSLELNIAKNRSGATKTVKLYCDIGANHVGDAAYGHH